MAIYGINFAGRHIDLPRFLQQLRTRAGLKDARIHDLRHTFASAPDAPARAC